MTELARDIEALLAAEGINQQALAERAQVSQATVSRARNGPPLRNGVARARLVRYMQQYSSSRTPAPAAEVLREVWDGTDQHALALAALLRASRELWPNLKPEVSDHKR
jgi:transcriptional regulator with XRE-family HTH domain